VTADLALGRVYPVLNVWGAGKSGLRDAEVVCDYFWSFTPKTSGAHYVTPHIEIHGYEVITLEHHCFHDSSGTTREFEVLMDVSQSGIVSPVAMAGPQNLGHGRIDTWRWPNYPTFLRADVEALAVVRIRLRAVARNEYARSSMNFGDPPAENFIGMPWLCWSEFT
jgi:hypothetical protein